MESFVKGGSRRPQSFNLMSTIHPAGGGCRATLGTLSLTHAQVGACDVHMVTDGFAISGSSSVPARTKIRLGRASAALNSGVPQAAQKLRHITLPLSATLRYSVVAPCTVKDAVGKQTLTVPLPAPRYWQTRHQHMRVTMGSDVDS